MRGVQMLIDFELLYTVILLIIGIIIDLKYGSKKNFINRLVLWSFILYTIQAIGYTFFPIPIVPEMARDFEEMNGVRYIANFIPFKDLHSWQQFFSIQYLGNLLLLFPLGIYMPLIFEKFHNFKRVVISGLLVTLIIELTQVVISFGVGFSYRYFDINDIILNLTGLIVGNLVLKVILPILNDIGVDLARKVSMSSE